MADETVFGSLAPDAPPALLYPPRNPARMPPAVENFAADMTVNPLWDVAQGVGAVATGHGTAPEVGGGIMGAIGLMAPGARVGRGVASGSVGLRGFHGTPRDISTVAAAPPQRQFDNATSQFGAFFAPSEQGAQRYAGPTGNIRGADLNFRNPYEMSWGEFSRYQSPSRGPGGEQLPGEAWAARSEALKQEAARHRAELESAGHDGVIVRNNRGDIVEIASFSDVPAVNVTPRAANYSAPGIRAYHGSPHDFERFDLSRIGTGEGAQAYGHGLYFAENPRVAESYKGVVDNGIPWWNPRHMWTPAMVPSGRGHMYEVNLRANPEQFLDYDRSIGAQSPSVHAAIDNLLPGRLPAAFNVQSGRGIYNQLGGNARASDALRDAGIPGIRYLDEGSRGSGQGTSNYVLFDDSLIDILRKYGLAGAAAVPAGGAAFGSLAPSEQ